MKVGYVSELNIKGFGKDFSKAIEKLVSVSESESLDFLVISGGISKDYHVTLGFINDLGKQLKITGTGLRFVAGNTDFYYPKNEAVIDKSKKFNEIVTLYRTSPYYLPMNPILTRKVRIIGAESWYDYTLYRGKPRTLKEISKKQILFFRNRDNDFITSADDYSLGLENTFDYKYSRECVQSLSRDLESQQVKHGSCQYNVVVTYFKGSKALLKDSYVGRYMGAFEGSLGLGEVLKVYRVSHCIYGKKSDKDSVKIGNTLYINPVREVKVVEYV